jgi:hypothetical protein
VTLDGERIFRTLVDEPPPPDPVESDDGGDEHHHLHIDMPIVAVFSDGSVSANGMAGLLILAWANLATVVTLTVAALLLCTGVAAVWSAFWALGLVSELWVLGGLAGSLIAAVVAWRRRWTL